MDYAWASRMAGFVSLATVTHGLKPGKYLKSICLWIYVLACNNTVALQSIRFDIRLFVAVCVLFSICCKFSRFIYARNCVGLADEVRIQKQMLRYLMEADITKHTA